MATNTDNLDRDTMDRGDITGERKVVQREIPVNTPDLSRVDGAISNPPIMDAPMNDPIEREEMAGEEDTRSSKSRDANPDAITGAPGSHPVGTGVGAAAAGAAGMAIGTLVMPGAGTVVGAVAGVVGAVAGGYAGKAVAEAIDPTDEDAYWRAEHKNRHYYDQSLDYDTDYGPAYRAGVSHYNANPQRQFNEAEADLQQQWHRDKGQSRLDWDRAKAAMKDVYERNRGGQSSGSKPNLD